MTSPQPADPVPPWAATVTGVRDLLPNAMIYADGTVPAGHRAVTEGQVRTWLVALSGRASITLDGWERLSTVVEDGAELSDRDRFAALARDAVHNGAASYVETARYPEQQATTGSYAAILWARYEATLGDVRTWLLGRLADPEAGDAVTGDLASDALAGYFPPVSFYENLRF